MVKKNDAPKSARNASARRQKKIKKISKPAIITLCVIGVILIALIAFLLTSAFMSDKSVVNNGVLINSYDISGYTKEQVIEHLSTIENPYESAAVTVKLENSDISMKINAKDIDLTIDKEKTADAALSYAKKNPFSALYAKTFKKSIDFVYSYDHLKLDDILNSFARKAGGTLVQHEINILEDKIVIHAGKEGLGVDVAKLRTQVLDSLKPAANETITATKVNTTPAPVDVEELFEITKREPMDAKYVLKDNDVVVEDDIVGRHFDVSDAKSLLKDFAPGSADVSIPFILQEPNVKADSLSTSLFKDVLGSYSTKYMTSNVPRSNNVELAAKYVNGKILLPGEEFSYNGVVGKRTVERGFRAASVYENNKMVDGLGGGICQTSSTIYAAVLYADLEVTERHEHSLEVSYAPLGMDATVAYGSLDFRFKNNTDAPIKIITSWGGGSVSAKIVGTKQNPDRTVKITTQTVSTKPFGVTEVKDETLPEGKTVVDAPGFKGHVVNTYKIIYENGKEIENKLLHKSTYTMVNKVVRVGTGKAAPSVNPIDPDEPTTSPAPDNTQEPILSPTPTPIPTPSSSPSVIPTPPVFPDGL